MTSYSPTENATDTDSPVVTSRSSAFGIVSPLSLEQTAALVAGTVVGTIAIALPAVAAVILYLEASQLIAGLLSTVWLLSTVSTWTPLPDVSVSARGITVTAYIVLIGGLISPVVAYRYAIERFNWYTLE